MRVYVWWGWTGGQEPRRIGARGVLEGGEKKREGESSKGGRREKRRKMFEFVVGSLPCSERFFSGYSGFPLSLKTNTSKFQFDLERTDTFQRVLMNSLSAPWVNKVQF